VPENTRFLDEDQPSGDANRTGTPTTNAKDRTIKAKRAIWNKKSIKDLITALFLNLKFGYGSTVNLMTSSRKFKI
jgi:hypothetical protein